MLSGEKISTVIVVPYLTGHGGMETVLTDVTNHYSHDSKIQMQVYFSQVVADGAFFENFNNPEQIINRLRVRRQTGVSKVVSLVKLASFLARTNVNEVICMSPILVKIAAVIKRVLHKKYTVISWIHFSLVGSDLSVVHDLLRADKHMAISSGIKRQLIDMGVTSKEVTVVYNPIETNVPMIPFKANHNGANFLYVGRVQWQGQKNLQELFQALVRLTGDWQLTIIGSGDDAQVLAFIKRHHLEGKVQLLGWQSRPWCQVQDIDCTVLSSKFEGLPMCIIESIIRGIPSVSSDCPTGPDDLIEPGKNGYIYSMGDSQQLAGILQQFIDHQVFFDHDAIKKNAQWLDSNQYYQRVTHFFEKSNGDKIKF